MKDTRDRQGYPSVVQAGVNPRCKYGYGDQHDFKGYNTILQDKCVRCG